MPTNEVHVHVYRVVEVLELDIIVERGRFVRGGSPEPIALRRALALAADAESVAWSRSEHSLLAVIPRGPSDGGPAMGGREEGEDAGNDTGLRDGTEA